MKNTKSHLQKVITKNNNKNRVSTEIQNVILFACIFA